MPSAGHNTVCRLSSSSHFLLLYNLIFPFSRSEILPWKNLWIPATKEGATPRRCRAPLPDSCSGRWIKPSTWSAIKPRSGAACSRRGLTDPMLRSPHPTFTPPFASFPSRKKAAVVSEGVLGESGRFHACWFPLMRSARCNHGARATDRTLLFLFFAFDSISSPDKSLFCSPRDFPSRWRMFFFFFLFFFLVCVVRTVRGCSCVVAVVTDRQALDPRCEMDGQMRATLPDDPPSQALEGVAA